MNNKPTEKFTCVKNLCKLSTPVKPAPRSRNNMISSPEAPPDFLSSLFLVLEGHHSLDFRIQHRITLPIFVLWFVSFIPHCLWASSVLCEVVVCSFSLHYNLLLTHTQSTTLKIIILISILNLVFSPLTPLLNRRLSLPANKQMVWLQITY